MVKPKRNPIKAKGKSKKIKKQKTSKKRRKVLIRKPKTQNPKPKTKSKKIKLKKNAVKKVKKIKSKTTRKISRTKKRTVGRQRIAVKHRKSSVPKEASHLSGDEFPAETLFKARIKVVGVGGGGGSIVSEIGRSLEKATFVIADTDIRALKKKPGIKYFWFGEELTHGLGTGVNIDLAKQAAESAKEKISNIFKDQDIIIFIASLGGGLGSGATQVFAEAAKEFGGITFGIFTLPFKFEGKNKARIAQNALKSLKQSLNVSLVIPNEKIFKIISADTPITEAFSMVNKSLIESLESLIDLIYSPGIINIDFADLRTILRGRGNSAFLNTIEESGKNRADKVCEKVLFNPLLQNNSFTAEKILFNIAGSDNLSMFEVEKVSSHIANLNPKAKIIFGISKNSKLKNKIKTTILMTGGEIQEKVSEKEKKSKKEEKGKKLKPKKPTQKAKKENEREEKPVSGYPLGLPVFESPIPAVSVVEQRRMNIIETTPDSTKNLRAGKHGTIRRSGLEIKKAEEQEEKKRIAQEKEWEIPAFLRRVKFNK